MQTISIIFKFLWKSIEIMKSIYGMTNSINLLSDEFTEWLLESGFVQYQYQMSIYYKYAPDGIQFFFLS